jgi:hypothetical protein
MSELLTPDEVRQLTGCVARDAQCLKLVQLGMPFMRDGARIHVSRELMRQRMMGHEFRQSAGPRLDLVK